MHSEDSDQTGRTPRLIWVFTGRTCHFVGWFCNEVAQIAASLALLSGCACNIFFFFFSFFMFFLLSSPPLTDPIFFHISCYFNYLVASWNHHCSKNANVFFLVTRLNLVGPTLYLNSKGVYSHIFAEWVCAAETPPFFWPDQFQNTHFLKIPNQFLKAPLSTAMSLYATFQSTLIDPGSEIASACNAPGFCARFFFCNHVRYNCVKFPSDATLQYWKIRKAVM